MLVVRLQALAFGEARRGVVGYYDLARDARAEHRKAGTKDERRVWKERLEDLGVRVGNALIDMGDLGAARRHFETLRGAGGKEDDKVLDGRLALLCLKMGDVVAARRYIDATAGDENGKSGMLEPLLSMADGGYEDAAKQWRALIEGEHSLLARQNLAVCLLYLGKLDEVRLYNTLITISGTSFRE